MNQTQVNITKTLKTTARMKWSLRPQRLKARILHIVTLTTNLVMIRAFAQHILQTQCVSGTGCGPRGQCLSGVLSLGTYLSRETLWIHFFQSSQNVD